MDMNKTFFLRKEDRAPKWHVIDAKDQTLGRLSTQIAELLRGKGKALFTSHTDCGDYVVVLNSDQVKVTGRKESEKEYVTYSGWRSGKKVRSFSDMMAKDSTKVIRLAVRGMLPKNKLSSAVLSKLKVYKDAEHPHQAQVAGQ